MEAGLPSWERLLEKLLVRTAREKELIDTDDPSHSERWVAEGRRDGYLGAAAIVDALAGQERDTWLREELFSPSGEPGAYYPGAISSQVAQLARLYGNGLRILTLNYDDLIEQALRDSGGAPHAIATSNLAVPAGSTGVYHLHGYLGRDDRPQGDLILSEGDYQRMQQDQTAWQHGVVHNALRDSTFIFVGTSLLDPNMIRYLYGVPAGGQRFAVFVRQGTYPQDVPTGIPLAREAALRERWEAVGVTPVFVDHYVDVAQVLYEIGRRREQADVYVPLPERSADWLTTIERSILGWDDAASFERAQRALNRLLASALDQAVQAARELDEHPWDEVLQLALWLVDANGERITNWVTTDRVHVDRRTIEPVEIDDHSRWVAVRSYCRGTPLAESRDIYASRWRFIRGTPLVLETAAHGRLPVGCLTTASLTGRDSTRLAGMDGDVERTFNGVLSDAILTLLDQPFVRDA